MSELTGFRRDLLRAVVQSDESHGLGIKEWMETNTDYGTVHHGRLYPNMDKLCNMGLVSKQKEDERTNEYALTQRGIREVIEYSRQWQEAAAVLE